MGNRFRRTTALILCAIMLICSAPMSGFASALDEVKTNVEKENELDIVDYSAGNVGLSMRLPVEVEAAEAPAVDGKLVKVNQYSKVYQTGSRTYSSVYSPVPNFYLDEQGIKHNYDNSIELENSGNSSDFTNKASDIDVTISTELAKKGITFEYDDVKVGLKPVEGDYSSYVVVDNSLRYNNVFDGIDVQYTINKAGVKELIILNRYVEKNVFSYDIDTNGNTVKLVDGVLYVYKGNDTANCIFTISAPIMTDASGAESNAVSLSLDGDRITITADAEWLSSAERAYPVYIDPDVIRIDSALSIRSVVEDGDRVYAADNYARGYAGYIEGDYFGFSGVLGRSKILVHIADNGFYDLPEGAGIIDASLNIYQYVSPTSSTKFVCSMITDSWNLNSYSAGASKAFTNASKLNLEYLSSSQSHKGWHNFDIRTAVVNWVNGFDSQNGLMITGQYDTAAEKGGAFITNTSEGAAGAGSYADEKPYIIINWEIPNPVDPNYPLDNTTINLRTISTSDRDGKLAILGVFADGVAKPFSTVNYVFNDSSVENQTYSVIADQSYKYPDSTAWNEEFAKQGRATKYKDILSNWQTVIPFTKFDFNTIYNWTATATLDNQTGNTAKTVDFLVYKITRYDTLSSIANYYGVTVDQLAKDNHVQDMLLVENNTIIITNPTRNATVPYNPGDLTDAEKAKIDGLLMGRAKHCEFGFEPLNINTGNFYMNQVDISIPDFNGDFAISRTYNSTGAGINSVFGRGWQFDYAESLAKLEDGEIVYRRGDGSSVYFTKSGDNYICTPGYYLELTPIKVDTKLGDFGGEEPEPYDVFEYEIKDAGGTVKRFSSSGLLKSITDSKGFVTTITYDDKSNFSSITSPAGTTYGITCDFSGKITEVTTPDGGKIKYSYDDNGNLVTYTNEIGSVVHYNYDDNHLMTSWSDGEDNVIVTNEYDSEGRVTKQTDATGNVTSLSYSAGKTVATDANGYSTTYNYDDNYRTTKITYADGSSETNNYDSANNLASTTDRSGNTTSYKYNADGFVTEKTRFDGAKQFYTYDADNNVIAFTDYNGKTESYTYDAKGNILSNTHKDGGVDSFEYDSKNRVVKSTDANGNATSYAYGDIWASSITDAAGNTTQFFYNHRGQVVTAVDALGNTTRFMFDAAGRKTAVQYADDSTEEYTYDKAGCLTSLKNRNGYVYSYTVDGMGNVVTLTDPLNNTSTFEYDGLYNNTAVDFGAGVKELYEFDCFSQTASFTDPEGNKTVYGYDAAGNVVSLTDGNGNETKSVYDLRFNEPETVTDALGNETVYEYDAVGNLAKETDANGNVTVYEYDSMNRLIKVTYANGLVVTNTYDAVGNLLKMENNSGDSTAYAYDNVYNLISVTYSNGAKLSYTYDALGRTLSEKDSVGAETKYTYDAVGRQTSVVDAIGRKTAFTYDANGNKLTEKTSNGGETVFVYDALDRMRKVTDVLGNSTFMEYDVMGNLISSKDALGNETKYEFNKNGLITKQTDPLGGAISYVYDANSNLVNATDALGYEAAIEYDALNRVKSTTDALGLVTEFTYDPVGNLLNEKNNNGLNNVYSYDAVGNLVKNVDSLGQATDFTYDLKGNILSVVSYDGTTTSYTYNTLNNVTSMTDGEGKTTEYTYDMVGNLLSEKDSLSREYKYDYDIVGRKIAVTDPLDQRTTYDYNEFDFVTKVTLPDGSSSSSEYDIGGNLIAETDANGNKTKYSYNEIYQLISVAYADNTSVSYNYDANGNILKATDARGNATEYEYDALGNALKVKAANNAVTAYSYDAAGNVLTETDALGSETAYIYDIGGRLVSKTLANGAVYTYTYDALDRLTSQTQPEGLGMVYAYDGKGNLQSETDQSGRATSYTYDIMHRLLTQTDAEGNTAEFTYDAAGNLGSFKTPNGYVSTYSYDVLDRIKDSVDPTGKTEAYTYDSVGNLSTYTVNGKNKTSYEYDKVGNMTSVTNALGYSREMKYNKVNWLVSESDFKGRDTEYSYDANGNITLIKNRENEKTEYTYDKVNNLVSKVDGEERKIAYGYDALNRVVTVSEDNQLTAAYEYDKVGNLVSAAGYTYSYDLNNNMVSATDALGNVTKYIYNENGMLETVKNANGTAINYDYDKIDELISKKYDESEEIALYGYDKDGNRITMEDVAGTTDYEYDGMGRITAVKLSNGTQKITYAYDEDGNLVKLGYPDGTSVSYTYDVIGQLTSVTNRKGQTTTYKYDENGNITEVHRPNNTYSELEYDKEDRITKVSNYGPVRFKFFSFSNRVISSYKYDYDKSGNIVKEVADTSGARSESGFFSWLISVLFKTAQHISEYEYDGRNQLVGEKQSKKKLIFFKSKLTETLYEYDKAGNRVKATENGKATTYKYDDAGRLVSVSGSKGSTEYTYDASGNLVNESSKECLKKTTKTYSYNNENRLTAVKENGKLLMAALYDGDGERLFVISDHECLINTACNDDNCKLLGGKKDTNEIDFDDSLVIDNLLIPNGVTKSCNYSNYDLTGYINNVNSEYTQVLMEYGANESVTAAYEYGANRESAEIDGKQYFYNYDGRGSVANVTDEDGKVVTSYTYDAFGEYTSTGKNIDNHYTYNAEYTDFVTELQYLRARYYRASTGSFTTADTYIGELTTPLSMNRYTYTHNNPVMGKDPSGHEFALLAILAGLTVAEKIALAFAGTYALYSLTPSGRDTNKKLASGLGSLLTATWEGAVSLGKSAVDNVIVPAADAIATGAKRTFEKTKEAILGLSLAVAGLLGKQICEDYADVGSIDVALPEAEFPSLPNVDTRTGINTISIATIVSILAKVGFDKKDYENDSKISYYLVGSSPEGPKRSTDFIGALAATINHTSNVYVSAENDPTNVAAGLAATGLVEARKIIGSTLGLNWDYGYVRGSTIFSGRDDINTFSDDPSFYYYRHYHLFDDSNREVRLSTTGKTQHIWFGAGSRLPLRPGR